MDHPHARDPGQGRIGSTDPRGNPGAVDAAERAAAFVIARGRKLAQSNPLSSAANG
ncbi:hypothetical protein JQ612_27270 [Bradyrhizobium manausense]|uniref:hypothetical protein n=1 Tax=Bradyrhizobium manausense TaxID=989370 RepID=UPI001BAC7DF0|nr:hypothetical protein [Bradyrhizobium manausense]MBR0836911.1 hypothetical protein [Bradyrhizobium manausense]